MRSCRLNKGNIIKYTENEGKKFFIFKYFALISSSLIVTAGKSQGVFCRFLDSIDCKRNSTADSNEEKKQHKNQLPVSW